MIKLHSRHCLVQTATGAVQSLDTDRLRDDLQRAFRACGVSEDWIGDHIALVVEEHAACPGAETPPLGERDLHAMVSSLLTASGYEDVGRRYREQLPASAQTADPDPFRPWDMDRLDQDLANLLPLGGDERRAMVQRLAAALAGLGLSAVRTELLRELARHLLQQSAAPPFPPASSPFLMLPGQWPLYDSPAAAALAGVGALRAQAVSRFLPRLRLELDLARLAVSLGPPPVAEMAFLPALAQALDAALALLAVTRRRLDLASLPPAHLIVVGLEAAVDDALRPPTARAGKALRHELKAIVAAKLPPTGATAVYASFR